MAASRICSIANCDKTHYAKGFCKAHYTRLLRHGCPLAGGTPNGDPHRFFEDVVRSYEGDECLIWPYTRNSKGYGRIRVDGKMVTIPRKLCEEVNGAPPTPKHEAAHSCGKGNLGCVTKGHLSWKTPKENNADKLTHGTHNRGERHGRAKITETQAREILSLRGKETLRSLADRFGVSRKAISEIHLGRNWAWL